MKILIQSHPQYNLSPMVNSIKNCMPSVQAVMFDETFNPVELTQKFQPDITIYHSDISHQNIIDIVNNTSGAKIQHVVTIPNQFLESSWQFSLSLKDHENYFPPRCNTFILKDPSFVDDFATDISFLGPPSQHAMDVLSGFMSINDTINLKIYGINQYLNWRYCGTVEEHDLKNIYFSSSSTICLSSSLGYDFRVLDCVYSGGRPIIEKDDNVLRDFPMLEGAMFEHGPNSRRDIIDILNKHRDGKLSQGLEEANKIIKEKHSWYNIASKMFNGIGLKSAARQIELTKENVV